MEMSVTSDQSQSELRSVRIAIILVLLLGALLSASLLTHLWWRLTVASIGVACFLNIVLRLQRSDLSGALSVAGFTLGVSLPLVNMFGSGALLTIECLVLAAFASKRALQIEWAFPWLMVLLISCLADFYWSLNPNLFISVALFPETISESLRSARLALPPTIASFLIFCRWLTMLGIFSLASRHPDFRERFSRGLVLSLLLGAAILCYQYMTGIYSFSPNQNSYWSAIKRFAGSFTDPNAYGLVALLALGFLPSMSSCGRSSAVMVRAAMLGAFLLLAVALSGSRTLIVGICFMAASFVRWRPRVILVGTILLIIAYLSLLQVSEAGLALARPYLPESIMRVAQSVRPDSAPEALSSRSKFALIGLEAWRDNPLFGVGLGRFREHIPRYADRAGIEIGSWLDNSNNFYLGILAELGLFGALCFLFSFARLRLGADGDRSAESDVALTMVKILLVVLIFGPHLDFDEVALLAAVLMAQAGFKAPEGARRDCVMTSLVLLTTLMVPFRFHTPQGLFARESSPGGNFVWTATQARIPVSCDSNGSYRLDIRAVHPDIVKRPISVEIGWQGAIHVVQLADHQRYQHDLNCGSQPSADSRLVQTRLLTLSVNRSFIPDKTHNNGDFRQLGVQLFSPVL